MSVRQLLLPTSLLLISIGLTSCGGGSSNDVLEQAEDAVGMAGSFQMTFTNLTTNQLMTRPVVALHDPSIHLFQVGEAASSYVEILAEIGNNIQLLDFLRANPEVVSAFDLAGDLGSFLLFPGDTATVNLTTARDRQVFSAVTTVICTNDGFVGVDSMALPTDNVPVSVAAVAYDAGTRENSNDAESFDFEGCRVGDAEATADTNPRASIEAHPGQTVENNNTTGPISPDNWDLAPSAEILRIEIVRN